MVFYKVPPPDTAQGRGGPDRVMVGKEPHWDDELDALAYSFDRIERGSL